MGGLLLLRSRSLYGQMPNLKRYFNGQDKSALEILRMGAVESGFDEASDNPKPIAIKESENKIEIRGHATCLPAVISCPLILSYTLYYQPLQLLRDFYRTYSVIQTVHFVNIYATFEPSINVAMRLRVVVVKI